MPAIVGVMETLAVLRIDLKVITPAVTGWPVASVSVSLWLGKQANKVKTTKIAQETIPPMRTFL